MKKTFLLAALAAQPALADHPLISEDAGLAGKGRWELQLHGERAKDRENDSTTRTTAAELELTYGLHDKADLKVILPYAREVTDGQVVEGRGDAALGVKYQFHEADRLKLLVKPQISFPTGRDQLGLGSGRTSWGADLLALYELNDRVELLGDLRYERNRNRIGEREPIWHVSAAVLVQAAEQLTLTANIAQETNADASAASPLRELAIGGIYELSQLIELGLGLKKGLNTPADDRALLFAVRLRL